MLSLSVAMLGIQKIHTRKCRQVQSKQYVILEAGMGTYELGNLK